MECSAFAELRFKGLNPSGECVRVYSASMHLACDASHSSHFSMCKMFAVFKCLLAAKTASQLAQYRQQTSDNAQQRSDCRILPCFDQFLSCFNQGKAEAHEKRIWLPHQKPGSGRSPFKDGWVLARFDWHTPKSDNGDGSCAHAPGQKRHIRHVLAVLVWILSLQWSQTYHRLLQREVLRFLRPLLEWVQSVQSKKSQRCNGSLSGILPWHAIPVQKLTHLQHHFVHPEAFTENTNRCQVGAAVSWMERRPRDPPGPQNLHRWSFGWCSSAPWVTRWIHPFFEIDPLWADFCTRNPWMC